MEAYKILKLDKEFECIVLSTSYVSPLNELYKIEEQLTQLGCNGEVVFDLLMSNGFSSNRLLKMRFDGEKFNRKSISNIGSLGPNILKSIYECYSKNPSYVDNSILPNAQKYLLKNNLIIV